MSPFFSIIIPSYNRANLISKTIKSLLEQEFRDFEIIVVDDGGTDHTKEVVESFGDKRISYFWKENAERGAARNFGLDRAQGNWILFFDSDDLAYANHLSTAYNYIIRHPLAAVFHTSYDNVDIKTNKVIKHHIIAGDLNKKIKNGNCLSCNNVFIRRDVIHQYRFSEKRELSGSEDWLLWLLLSRDHVIGGITEITSALVQHQGRSMATVSGKHTEKAAKSFVSIAKEYPGLLPIVPKITAEVYSLAALRYALDKERKDAIRCSFTAIKARPLRIFSKRFLATLKYLIISRRQVT
jgi:glycosyltransferase involved in cell wall biosynthesis